MSNKPTAHRLLGLLIAAAVALPMAASAQATGATAAAAAAGALSKSDQKIVMDMAMANMAEVELGKLALSKAQSAEIKSFAQQMVDDHGKALGEVQALAQSKGVALPTALDAKHKAEADKLGALSGAEFDKAYAKQAGVSDHAAVHAKLSKFAKQAKDADVKALAGKMLPTVAQHLEHAKMLPKAAKAAPAASAMMPEPNGKMPAMAGAAPKSTAASPAASAIMPQPNGK